MIEFCYKLDVCDFSMDVIAIMGTVMLHVMFIKC